MVQTEEIKLVDQGRGLQLSTSRILVQDLVPYFQEGCSYEEIIRWLPTLSREEIEFVETYYRNHQKALDDEDQQIRARTEGRIRQQRLRFPQFEGTSEERMARLKELLRKRLAEKNGEGHTG